MKIGLEIHQQLDTHKLFCNCPSILVDSKPTIIVHRKLKAVESELGEYDVVAKAEEKRNKEYIYFGYPTTCLVELDEEPPREMNRDAVEIALQIAELFHMKVVDEIQVMRKMVLDGSNTTGFQRTALVAYDGYIETSKGKVRIETLCLEEDSARKVAEEGNKVIYSLDRLGIPLLEITTAPDIKSPEHAKEVAEKIGLYLRMAKVKRGLGTIRQDINVSLKNVRVEIKGFQELSQIPKVVENEIIRQKNMYELSKKIKKVNFHQPLIEITSIFENTESKLVKSALEKSQKVFGFKVPKFKGLFKWNVQEGKRLARDLVEYVKYFTGVKGFIHSDELPGYGIKKEISSIEKELKVGKEDAFILLIGDEDLMREAYEKLVERLDSYKKGVIPEVRAAEETTTRFLRPMPGKARLYPETDVPPVKPWKVEPLEPPEQKLERYKNLGLSEELANQIIWKDYKTFEEALEFGIKPSLAASLVMNAKGELKAFGVNYDKEKFVEALKLLGKKYITKEVFYDVLAKAIKENISVKEAVDKLNLKRISKSELKRIIDKVISENPDLKDFKVLMGLVMRKVRGRIEGNVVAEELKKRLK